MRSSQRNSLLVSLLRKQTPDSLTTMSSPSLPAHTLNSSQHEGSWLRRKCSLQTAAPAHPPPTPGCSLFPLVLWAACCQHLPVTAWRGSRRAQAPWDSLPVLGRSWSSTNLRGGGWVNTAASRGGRAVGGRGGEVGQLGDTFSAPSRVSRCLSGNLLMNTPYSGFLSLLVSPSHFLLVLPDPLCY